LGDYGKGTVESELGKYAEAEQDLLSGYKKLAAARAMVPFENREDIDRVRKWIVRLYEHWGRPDAAASWRLHP